MKKVILLLLIICTSLWVKAQNLIVQYEYWFDNNYSTKIVNNITPIQEFNLQTAISTTDLSVGLHTFHIRFLDNSARWSAVQNQFFLKTEPKQIADKKITGYEYWFDNNYSSKVNQTIAEQDSVNLINSIKINNLNEGIHTFHIRFSDNSGQWSATQNQFFINVNTPKLYQNKIVAYRYWADTSFVQQQTLKIEPINPFTLNTTSFLSPKIAKRPFPNNYEFIPNPYGNSVVSYMVPSILHFQFQDSLGLWSSPTCDTINVKHNEIITCDTLLSQISKSKTLPKKDSIHFFLVKALKGDSLVFKTNKALIVDLYDPYGKKLKTIPSNLSWSGMGVRTALDGNYYALVHGFGTFTGTYNVTYKRIAKYAILGYDLKKVGNKGFSMIEFEGNGFTKNVTVKLVGNDTTLIADTVYCKDLSKINVMQNFDKAPIGFYDIEVNFGDTIIKIQKGIEIEQYEPIIFDLKVIGPKIFRRNAPVTYTIKIENLSNITAFGVPLSVKLLCRDSSAIQGITINNQEYSKIPISDLSKFPKSTADSIINYFSKLDDKHRFLKFNDSINAQYIHRNEFYITKVPPKSTYYFSLTVKSSSDFNIIATVPRMVKPIIIVSKKNGINGCCLNDGIQCIVGLVFMYPGIEKLMKTLPIDEKCVIGLITNTLSFTANIYCDGKVSDNINNFDGSSIETINDLSSAILSSIISCLELKEFSLIKRLCDAYDFMGKVNTIKECVDVAINSIAGNCNNEEEKDEQENLAVNSCDPNDKIGYRSPSGSLYFNKNTTNFTYIINFENKESASAPAQEVYITDTIDMNVFDIKSFKAGSIKIGNKVFPAKFNSRDYSWIIDMRPEMFLRTEIKLTVDTINGIAHWYFKSIDPFTNNLPENPLIGFLPPNTSTGSGQGFVSFYINLKNNLEDALNIKNKASIVFDYNAPITTPEWKNILDSQSPVSKVLPLTENQTDSIVSLTWQGADVGSGILNYTIFVSKDDSEYSTWITTSKNTENFIASTSGVYKFYSIAIDSANNVEPNPNTYDAKITIDKSQVGINNNRYSDTITLYPNPANTALYITGLIPHSNIEIFDISGKIVLYTQVVNMPIDISKLEYGIYIIKITNKNRTATKKFVKQ